MTDQYLWSRITTRDHTLRAADADRDRIATRLRTNHAEGRLDTAELEERLELCYAARTLGELSALVTDLPRPRDQARGRPSPPWRLAALAPILLALLLVSAVAAHPAVLWIPVVFMLWRLSWWRRRRWSASRHGIGPGEVI